MSIFIQQARMLAISQNNHVPIEIQPYYWSVRLFAGSRTMFRQDRKLLLANKNRGILELGERC